MKRLSWRLAGYVTLGIAFVHAVFGYLRIQREGAAFESDMRRDHAAIAHALGVAALSTAGRTRAAIDLIEDADLRTDRAEIRWVGSREPQGAPEPRSLTPSSEIREHGSERSLVSRLPLRLGSEAGELQIRESLAAEQEYLAETVVRSVFQTLVAVALCCAVLLVAGWVLLERPMAVLFSKLERIGQGDFDQEVELRRPDELGALDRALTRMCQQLQALRQAHEREVQAKLVAQEQLRHAERLSTVGKLAAGVAHELGTPLNVVSARAKMIIRGQSEGPSIVEDAQIIVDQTERMTRIIRQLLDFARQGHA